jgi:hypothetical protein
MNKAQLTCYNPVCTKQIQTTKSSNSKDVFFDGKNLSDFKIIIFLPHAGRQPQDRRISQRF